MRLFLSALVCAAVLLSSGTPARAITLSDPSVTGTVLFNLGGRQDTTALGTLAMADPAFGSVAVTLSGTPSPSIVANADIGPNALASIYGRGVGGITYYFAIEGPAGSVPVLIDVAGAAIGNASAGASFAVESRWTLFDGIALANTLAGDDVASTQLTGTFDQGFARTVSLTLLTNHVYPVLMLADAQAAATDAGSQSVAHAFVDPVFSFGPGVDPSLYSFTFSNGIGNVAAPEPGLLALSIAGLLSVGVLRRRGGQKA